MSAIPSTAPFLREYKSDLISSHKPFNECKFNLYILYIYIYKHVQTTIYTHIRNVLHYVYTFGAFSDNIL